LQILQAAVRPFQHDRVYFLAITRPDTFAKGANYVFGLSKNNDHYAVMSYRRFTADFWKAAPNRERLLERAVKQAMSSVGFMPGVPRCTSPTCARAFPNSLAEHDAKSLNLCPACSNGFVRALFNNRQ
jgi:predicted Zn-dependent protease